MKHIVTRYPLLKETLESWAKVLDDVVKAAGDSIRHLYRRFEMVYGVQYDYCHYGRSLGRECVTAPCQKEKGLNMGLPFAVGFFAVFMLCICALIAWYGNKIMNEDDEKTVR